MGGGGGAVRLQPIVVPCEEEAGKQAPSLACLQQYHTTTMAAAAAAAAGSTKTTDVSAVLARLQQLPDSGRWGLLYSTCIPPAALADGQQGGTVQLQQQTGLDMSKLAALLATISRDASAFPGATWEPRGSCVCCV